MCFFRNSLATRHIYLTIILVCFASFNSCFEGQAAVLPQVLPIGDQASLSSWIVTNQPSLTSMLVRCTNGTIITSAGQNLPNNRFVSYDSFQQWVVTNGFSRLAALAKITNIVSHVLLDVVVSYVDSNGDPAYVGLNALADIGPVAGITSNSFINALANPVAEQFILPVTNLQQLVIQVDSTPPYSFMWSPSSNMTQSVALRPFERTTNDLVVLNQWYLLATNRTRFTITANNQANTYTQNGDLLAAASLRMPNRTNISVTMTRGSDTILLATTNFVAWQPIATNSWSAGTNKMVTTINPLLRSQFFRAFSQ